MRCGPTPGGCRPAIGRGPTGCCCSATRCTPTRCRRRRSRSSVRAATSRPPGEEVADFEEYTRLYLESWSDPDIRWLLSTVPSTMIFDDHDVSDDWNISQAWVDDMRAQPWWDERITAPSRPTGSTSTSATWRRRSWPRSSCSPRCTATTTPDRALRTFAAVGPGVGCEPVGVLPRLRPLAGAGGRLARGPGADRRPTGHGRRREWDWIIEHARGSFDHLVIVSTLPVFMPHGIYHLESWNEAVCAGAGAGGMARRAPPPRPDLEHWAAFQTRSNGMVGCARRRGRDGGGPPATVTLVRRGCPQRRTSRR